jgi:hypothetical protein
MNEQFFAGQATSPQDIGEMVGTQETMQRIDDRHEENYYDCVENAVRRADGIHRQRVLEAWQRRINEGHVPKEFLEPSEVLDLMIDGARDFVFELMKVPMSPEAIHDELISCFDPFGKDIPYPLVKMWVRDYQKLGDGNRDGDWYATVLSKGLNEGYNKGYADGFEKGYAKGYDNGFDDDVYKEGYDNAVEDDDNGDNCMEDVEVQNSDCGSILVTIQEQVVDKVATVTGGGDARAESIIGRRFVSKRVGGRFITIPMEQFLKENPEARNATWDKIDAPVQPGHIEAMGNCPSEVSL